MNIDPAWLKFGWEILVSVAGLGGGVLALWARVHFARKSDMDGLGARVDQEFGRHNDRITVLEQAVIHAPDKEDIGRLEQSISDLGQELSELRGEQRSQNKLLATIHDHLLNGGRQ